MSGKRVILAAGILFLFSLSANAQTTLYVNGATGNDGVSRANNSAATPWRTIGRAAWGSTNRSAPNANEAARAGDTVLVAAGTYNFSGSIGNRWDAVYNPVNQGSSASNPITFEAAGLVSLTAPSTSSPVIGCSGRNHIQWRGPFSLDEASISVTADTGTVVLVNATGCGVDGISIDGNGMPAYVDNHTGVRVEMCQSCSVRNTTIHDVRHQRGNHNGSAVMLYNSDNTIIENNYIYSVDNAVFIKGVFGINDPQSGTIVRNNLLVACDECVTVSDSRDSRIYQNVIRDSQVGVNLLARDPGPYYHPVGDWFVNNTLDNIDACIMVGGGQNHENVRVWNNILTNCRNANYRLSYPFSSNGAAIDWEHNAYYAFSVFADDSSNGELTSIAQWRSSFGHDSAAPAAVTTNPMYANEAANDFRLCTGAGNPVASCGGASGALSLAIDILDLDHDGSTTDVIRAGAYVTNSEIIGPSSLTSLPRAVTGLRILPPN